MKKLYRSRRDRIICGVIGGVGEYFEIDPTLLRLVWLVIVIFSGVVPGLIVYILACFIVPRHHG